MEDKQAPEGDKHPQDVYVLQHAAWLSVWHTARAHENFLDFKEEMERMTLRLRWTKTREDESNDRDV